jgi:hypothetical protein
LGRERNDPLPFIAWVGLSPPGSADGALVGPWLMTAEGILMIPAVVTTAGFATPLKGRDPYHFG